MTSVTTAGIFIRIDGCYLFMLGPGPGEDHLGIVRIGGHLEAGEDAQTAARREALEEAQLLVELVDAPRTWFMDSVEGNTMESGWPESPRPLLASGPSKSVPSSVTFLARARNEPSPDSETAALVYLSPDDIKAICGTPMTLGDLVARGARVDFRRELDHRLPLRPRLQVRFLADLLAHEPAFDF